MATIEKRDRKSGTVYRAVVRIKGFPAQRKTFKRLTDAKMWVQQTEASIRKGEFKNVIRTANSKTLADVIDRYRNEVLPHKAETTRRAETTYLGYWERELGEYALSYIEAEQISKKLGELATAGDGRCKADEDNKKPTAPKSRKTLKHYRDTLAVLFKYAMQWGWTGSTPLDGVNPITKIKNGQIRYLSDDERKRLLKACRASDNAYLYPVVVFALSTGARKSEILSLKRDDLELAQGKAILRDTKNSETRAAPVVGYLKEVLKDHLKAVKKSHPKSEWLFPRADGEAPMDIRKAWENARDAATVTNFRFHDLRHSTASYLAMNGATQLEIAEVLGHKTLQMVRRYAHLSEDHTRDVVERMNGRIF